MSQPDRQQPRFEVAFSFPGEYRERVEAIASILAESVGRPKVFYDRWFQAELARPNLDSYLSSLYSESRLLVVFLCSDYQVKEWCGLEWRAVRNLLRKKEDGSSMMFLRLDRADLPGILSIDGYLDISAMSETNAADAILDRLDALRGKTVAPPQPSTSSASGPLVFLSYSQRDRGIAENIASHLAASDFRVWFDAYSLQVGDSISATIDRGLAASDFLLVLLSPHSAQSRWIQQELEAAFSSELTNRAITVVPVLLEDCEIPVRLRSLQYFDLRHDREHRTVELVEKLRTARTIDFAKLSPGEFEELVADLLQDLGFSVQATPATKDRGIDLIARFNGKDPFGAEISERWLIECKHYRNSRAGVESIQRLTASAANDSATSSGLLVTSSQFTSAAREWAEERCRRGDRLRLMDGTELKRLLILHSNTTRKHFKEQSE